MLHYKRPYSSPEEQAALASLFDTARPLSGLAGGVRPKHLRHHRVVHNNLAALVSQHRAHGNGYARVRATDLRRRFNEALAASALEAPPRGDYERLIDNVLHMLPAGCEVRFTIHTKQPVHANPAPKAYIFKLETPPEGGAQSRQAAPSGTTGSASPLPQRSR